MRVSPRDSWDTIAEQMNMRYSRTYTTNHRGLPICIRDVTVESPRDEEGNSIEADDPLIQVIARTRNGNTRVYTEEQVVWDVWPRHHVLFKPEWGGVVVWEKRPDRQIKKLPCDSNMIIVGGAYRNHPLMGGHGYHDIVEAMRTPQYHDVETARQMIRDRGYRAVPISMNAYITDGDVVYYHNLPLGSLDEAKQHHLWKIIQKESM